MSETLAFQVIWRIKQKYTQGDFTFAIYNSTRNNPAKTAKLLSYNNTGTVAQSIVIPKAITIEGESYNVVSIGSKAFSNKENLLQVTIPNTVTDIYPQAFENSSITGVIFEEQSQLNQIHKQAFCSCKALCEIIIPASVTYIAEQAFYDCSSTVIFEINSKLQRIEKQAFSGIIQTDTCSISEIPDSVTYIGQKAFARNRTAEIKLNKSSALKTLGSAAFAESAIQKICIPKNLAKISTGTFNTCESLQQIDFADYQKSVGTVDIDAFANCKSLKNIKIPASVIAIKDRAFKGCSNLESIEFEANSKLSTIESYAFCQCGKLASIINLPEEIEYGKEGVFEGCTNLVNINNSNGIISQLTSTLIMGLTNKEIPSNVVEIGEHAFAGLASLVSLVIPENINTIAVNAFLNCTGLQEIFIPKSVIFMKSNAFKGCSGLTIKCAFNKQPITWANDWNPDNCPVIWGYADNSIRDNCFDFILSDDQTYYKVKASPEGLNRASILTIPGVYKGKPVKVISADGFSGCKATQIDILPGITTIEDRAFKNCSLAYDINFPNTLEYIGEAAFQNCSALNLIQLSDSVKTIKKEAFRNCGNRTDFLGKSETMNIYIPKTVEKIENGAFLGINSTNCTILCENTTSEVTSKINSGNWGTYWASSTVLDGVFGTPYVIKYNVAAVTDSSNFEFSELSDGSYCIRPKEALIVMNIPKYYNNKLVTEISSWRGDSTAKQASLVKVILPDSIKTINGGVFRSCKNLSEINIPSSVTTIKMFAFGGDRAGYATEYSGSGITKIVIPDSVATGAEGLFKGCQLLRHVSLPDHWEEINSDMFNRCSSLTDIILPTNCKYIGEGAFADCTSLLAVHITKKYWMAGDTYLDLSTKTAEEVAQLIRQYSGIAWRAITPTAPELDCKIIKTGIDCHIKNNNDTPQAVTVNVIFIDNSEGYNKAVAKNHEIFTIGANKTVEKFFFTPFDFNYYYLLDYTYVTLTAQFASGDPTIVTYLPTGEVLVPVLTTEDNREITDESENLLVVTGVNYTDVQILDPAVTYNSYKGNQTTHSFTITNYNDFNVTCNWSGGDSSETGTVMIPANEAYDCIVTDSNGDTYFEAQFIYNEITSNKVSGSYMPATEFNFKLTASSTGIMEVSDYTETVRIDEVKTISIRATSGYTVSAYVTNADYTLTKDKLGLLYTLSVYNAHGNVKVVLSAIKPFDPLLPEMKPLD